MLDCWVWIYAASPEPVENTQSRAAVHEAPVFEPPRPCKPRSLEGLCGTRHHQLQRFEVAEEQGEEMACILSSVSREACTCASRLLRLSRTVYGDGESECCEHCRRPSKRLCPGGEGDASLSLLEATRSSWYGQVHGPVCGQAVVAHYADVPAAHPSCGVGNAQAD